MIDQVLHVLSNELNMHLQREGEIEDDLSMVAGPKSPNNNEHLNKLVLTVVNVEQETLQRMRNQLGHNHTVTSPHALNGLNLYVLVKSDFSDHSEALKRLSDVISFFHKMPAFNQQNSPALPERIERFTVEHENMDLQSASNLWRMLGARYVPAVLYKVRLLVAEEDQFDARIQSVKNSP